MTGANLQEKKVAILATDGFEQVELLEPRRALDEAGAKTQVVSPKDGKIRGWNMPEWGNEVPVDIPIRSAKPDEFDALLLPGGVMNPDHLRMDRTPSRSLDTSSTKASPSLPSATAHGHSSKQCGG